MEKLQVATGDKETKPAPEIFAMFFARRVDERCGTTGLDPSWSTFHAKDPDD